MKELSELSENQPVSGSSTAMDEEAKGAILLEMEKILASTFFCHAARSSQFLTYVVEHQLNGRSDLLKERTIGTEVFLRPAGYATGDDPVVRVQAGEVRRRLEQYYQAAPKEPPIRIELPVGTYTPVFRIPSTEAPADSPTLYAHAQVADPVNGKRRFRRWAVVGICAALALGAVIVGLTSYRTERQKTALDKFWSPVFATQQPALICLAKGVTYRPSLELYQKYALAHPGTYRSEVERSNEPLPLDAKEKLSWDEMLLFSDYGVAAGDVSSAVKFSALFGKIGKPNQVRIGANYSFQDLRNSPAVVVGAFNNKWTMELTSTLHFALVEEDGKFMIREQIPGGRVWMVTTNQGIPAVDFAIVGRLLDSKTGQFTIVAAGITGSGTQAAGEFATNPEYLEQAIRNAPADWQMKNMEVILQTAVTDSVAGPPRVVATYFW
jgi:hypothetical protein